MRDSEKNTVNHEGSIVPVKKENQQIRATVGGESLCMTCRRVSPLSTQSTFEDLAVDFEGTTASGAERFYRRTLDKLRLKLLESRLAPVPNSCTARYSMLTPAKLTCPHG